MFNEEKGKANVVLIVIISIIIILVIGIGLFFIFSSKDKSSNNSDVNSSSSGFFSKSIKDEVVTAENYQDLSNRIAPELNNEDEAYQFVYACMYYIMQDGMAVAFDFNSTDEEKDSKTYERVYGKTVKQLINEGKQLMKDNDMTVEKFKQSMEDFANNMSN